MIPPQLVLGFSDYSNQAKQLANALDIDYIEINLHRFPDGESKIQIPELLPPHVIVCRSLNTPNNKLIELLLVNRTCKLHGCENITLVCPYLCYMRQDIAFNPGEAISQQIIGQFLASMIDNIITVDPHLHRIDRLEQAIPVKHAIALSAAPLIGEFLAQKFDSALLVGPDIESQQWVSVAAQNSHFEYIIAKKIRNGDSEVEVTLPDFSNTCEVAIIVDDIASTGHTLIHTAKALKKHAFKHIHCMVTHALLSADALVLLQNAGIEHIWSTDSISHWSNKLTLTPLIANSINSLISKP